MFAGYQNIQRAHARASMVKQPEILELSSGMGDAEIIDDLDRQVMPRIPVQKAKVESIQTMDDTLYLGRGSQVKPDQFPKLYYMGEGDGVYGL
jgi:hypothetical protein